MERCSINRTWLIEYNQVKSLVKIIDVLKLINNRKEINV